MPERKRFPQQLRALLGLGAAGLRDERFEARQVEPIAVDAQDVAGRLRLQRLRTEELSQMRYEILERRRRRLRGSFTPQLVDEPLGRNDLARVHEEERQQRSLLLAAQRNRAVISDDLERTQDPELDHGFL